MLKVPTIYSPETIQKWDNDTEIKGVTNSMWVPARAEPFRAVMLGRRIYVAWKVFTGAYDALEWTETDPRKRQLQRRK